MVAEADRTPIEGSTISAGDETATTSGREGGLAIRGWVRDTEGRPVVGAVVSTMQIHASGIRESRWARSDPTGTFLLDGPPAAEYEVVAQAEGYLARWWSRS